jgi:ubiquinone/menaquinone biosynthesis C-methylase UbiE
MKEHQLKTDRKEQSRLSFDRDAATYDTSRTYASLRARYQLVVDETLRHNFGNCLDIGCGMGELLSMIVRERRGVDLCGLDLSEQMIKVAKEKLGKSARLMVGDSEALPFEDNEFDLVMCTFSFHHYPNPKASMVEMRRVLATNGKLMIADGWMPLPLRQFVNLIMRFGNDGDVKFYSRKELCGFAQESGLEVLKWTTLGKQGRLMVAEKVA